MARSPDLDALTGDGLIQLMAQILERLPAKDPLTVRMAAEAKRQEKVEAAKQAVLEETEAKLAEIGVTLDDVLKRPARRGGTRRRRRDTGQASPVKYRGPEGEAWTGRGRAPQWLQALEEQGRNRDEFLASQEAQ